MAEGIELKSVGGSRLLGAYLCPQEDLEAWVTPKMEAWDHRVIVSSNIAKQHPQLEFSSLGVSLKL